MGVPDRTALLLILVLLLSPLGARAAGLGLPAPTRAAYAELGRKAAAELADLRLERPLARTVVEEVIGGLAFGLTDAIGLVLRALKVQVDPGFVQVPVRWLLRVLDLRGIDTTAAREVLEHGDPDTPASWPRELRCRNRPPSLCRWPRTAARS